MTPAGRSRRAHGCEAASPVSCRLDRVGHPQPLTQESDDGRDDLVKVALHRQVRELEDRRGPVAVHRDHEFTGRQGARKATIDAAFATPSSQLALTVADEAGAAPVNAADAGGPLAVGGDANASEAAVVGEKTDAGSGAEAVAQGDAAAVVDEAAAELEARLAAERRRRRERERERALQQAAEEAGTSAAEPSEAGASPAVAVREVDAEAPAPRAAASESPRKSSPAESTDASAPRRAAPAEEDGGT